jgi:hypothetical protein
MTYRSPAPMKVLATFDRTYLAYLNTVEKIGIMVQPPIACRMR